MSENNGSTNMKWLVIGVASFLLVVNVIASLFNPETDTKSAYFLFGTVVSLVFGASIVNQYRK